MHKALILFLVAFAALALCALAGAAGSSPSTLTFTDPTGDAAGAPDITNVDVNGDAGSGTITFTLRASGLEPTTADGGQREVDVWLNTDRKDSTGSSAGNEYVVYFWTDSTDPAQSSWGIGRWAGSDWQEVPQSTTMHGSRNGDQFTIQVNKADLGGATSFSLYATAASFDANGNLLARDLAPDSAAWVYDIAGPTRTLTTFLTPTIGKPVLAPARPAAGKRLTVSFPVTTSEAGKPAPLKTGTMVGTPSVAGKVVAHTQSFRSGVAKLSFLVPRAAKGKTLRVKVTIIAPSSQGETGIWIDIARGEQGLVGTNVQGGSATRTVSIPVR